MACVECAESFDPCLPGDEVKKEFVNININGIEHQVEANISAKEACRRVGINVPTICAHPRVSPAGKCKVCVVEILGDGPKLACSTRVKEGMKIITNSQFIKEESRSAIISVFRKQHLVNSSSLTSEMEDLISVTNNYSIDESYALHRDSSLCIDCTRCVRACSELQGMNILSQSNDDSKPYIITQGNLPISQTECISCGQCAVICPTGAITEHDDIKKVITALNDKNTIVVLQTAPATRVAIAECFGINPGEVATGKLIAAAKRSGFSYVFDTNFAADLTIMEEGNELISRIKNGGPFPMFTSCCPGWINMVEKCYPQFIPNLSTCRSPHMMLAPLIRTYWASKMKIDPNKIFSVSMMPCTAKKDDLYRTQMFRNGKSDLDVVLTTRELGRLLSQRGITTDIFNSLKDENYDSILGASTGAAALFGVTGGVMEAALRTVYEVLEKKPLPKLELSACRGLAGVKETKVNVAGIDVKIAITSGGANVRALLQRIAEKKECDYHFIEVMACPNGCIYGGGQPSSLDPDVVKKRMMGIYKIDHGETIRKSHENPEVKQIYEEFLKEPLGHKSHELLHTHYTDRMKSIRVPHDKIDMIKSQSLSGPSGGILVLFGSQGGKTARAAKMFVEDLTPALAGKKTVRCLPLDHYDTSSLKEESYVILLCSTFGEGELPDNAKSFYAALQSLKDTLDNVKYCVCGLGSSEYKNTFNQAARMLDSRFSQLGAEQILERVECDDKAVGGYFETFSEWSKRAIKILGGTSLKRTHPRPPRYSIGIALRRGTVNLRPSPPGYQFCPIRAIKTLTAYNYEREVRQFDIDLEGSGFRYTTGDHIAILPRNDPFTTQTFIRSYGLDPQASITITNNDLQHRSPFPTTLTIGELFEQYVDFNAPPTSKFFEDFQLFCNDDEEMRRLDEIERMASTDKKEYGKFVKDSTILSIFQSFPRTTDNIPFEHLLSIVPVMHPRLYSIASSSLVHPNVVQVAIVIYKWQTISKNETRIGTCTNYLFNLINLKATVACYIKDGLLRYPIDSISKPTLMFGLGSGVGVMRAFIQEREALKAQGMELGPCHFWQACRHAKKDQIYADETGDAIKKNIITKHFTAFSHDQKEFITIPYKIDHDPKLIWELAKNEDTLSLYCGPAFGIPQTIQNSIKLACIKEGGLSEKEATLHMSKLVENWIVECYS